MKNYILLLLLFFIGLFSVSCNDEYKNELEDIGVEKEKKEFPLSVSKDVRIVIYDESGKEAAIIYGDTAEVYQDKNKKNKSSTIINNMKVLIKSSDAGETDGTLISDYGKLGDDSSLEAWGNVVFIKQDEFRMETEKIIWNPSTDKNNEQDDGILKTEPGKHVTIYYADGSIVKGKNGIWKQKTNLLVLEESYTAAPSNSNSEDILLSPSQSGNE